MQATLEFDQGRLISTMAFALRHDPAQFGLELDEEGWTSFEDLIIAIRFERYDWAFIDESLIKAIIAGMDRFESRDGKIRAVYGHSVELAKPPAVATPPALLFHGAPEASQVQCGSGREVMRATTARNHLRVLA